MCVRMYCYLLYLFSVNKYDDDDDTQPQERLAQPWIRMCTKNMALTNCKVVEKGPWLLHGQIQSGDVP